MCHRPRIPSLGEETSEGKPFWGWLPKSSLTHSWCLKAWSSPRALLLFTFEFCRLEDPTRKRHLAPCSASITLSVTHTEPSWRDDFKSGWEGKLCFYLPCGVPGKICPSSLFGHVIAVCHLLAPTPCKLRISSLFCQPLVPLAGLSRAVSRWGIIYLCLCQQHIIQTGETAAIMMHFSFTQMNQSLASLVNKK